MGLMNELKRWARGEDIGEEMNEYIEPADSYSDDGDFYDTVGNTSYPTKTSSNDKIVKIHATTRVAVVLVKPEKFDNAAEIADHLKDKRAVLLNLENANKEVSRRLVDFLSGVAYANEGKIAKIATCTYMIAPYNIDVMDELLNGLDASGATL